MADDTTQKDLDFDELHKAVSELMDKAQKGRSKRSKQSAKPVTQESASSDESVVVKTTNESTKPVVEPEENTNVTVTVKRPLPTLTSHKTSHGRAMDVVGPRDRPKTAAPSAAVRHQAQALQPTGADLTPEAPMPVVVSEHQTLAEKPKTPNELEEALASLGKQGNTQPSEVGPTMTHQADKLLEPDAEEQPAPAEKEEKEPENATPFITTKVEKRPLGAYAAAASADDKAEPEEASKAEKATDDDKLTKADQEDMPNPLPAQPQPAELGPEVVAVESAESESSKTPAQDEQDYRAMGIPQQYHEFYSEEDDSPRPVFDTTQYHPAIEAHASTHHSALGSWVMVILFIVLLLVVLGAVYYFLTGSLDFTALFT
jgi:hypothetical protein